MVTVNAPVTRLKDIIRELDVQQGADMREIGKTGGDYARFTRSVIAVRSDRPRINDRVGVITSPEGAPSDPHLHQDFNEWWVVLGGEVTYQIGQYEPFAAHFGDIVMAPSGYRHDIRPTRGAHCIRMVNGPEDSNHELKGIPPARLVPLDNVPPPNRIFTPLEYMIARYGLKEPWAQTVIADQRNTATMVHQLPGQTGRPCWHPDTDKWWVVLRGEVEFKLGETVHAAGPGDILFAPKAAPHVLRTTGPDSSLRVAVTRPSPVTHYLDDPTAPKLK